MSSNSEKTKAYLVGGGIAALSAAVYLIRDGSVPAKNIHIMEELKVVGGSLDGIGDPENGYIIRGGRMFNLDTFECLWDLLKFIPSVSDPKKNVMEEILEFNNSVDPTAKTRVVGDGPEIIDTHSLKLTNADRISLVKLLHTDEEKIGDKSIEEWFPPSFFESMMWTLWASMFAFQPWHSVAELRRYAVRFAHLFDKISVIGDVHRTPLNQYDSLILPLKKWLEEKGVDFMMNVTVTDLDFKVSPDEKIVERLHYKQNNKAKNIDIAESDIVLVTNGSMTESSTLGSMKSAPEFKEEGACWDLWKNIAGKQPDMGTPSRYSDNVVKTFWESFTVTCKDPTFFKLHSELSKNKQNIALTTFKDSSWLFSIVLFKQPHFANQPDDIQVFWGYALRPFRTGDYVKKRMCDCSGEEILREVLHHLKWDKHMEKILETSNVIPCNMPYITSQFMPRAKGDRPDVVPKGSKNLGFIGQFAEIPGDVVFTVEYSVRSAQMAVYKLLNLPKKVPKIKNYQYKAKTVLDSIITMFR